MHCSSAVNYLVSTCRLSPTKISPIVKSFPPNVFCYPRPKSTISVPVDAWDSHIHVTDPVRYPTSKAAKYQPHSATLSSALANADRLKLPNLVFVQPSTYGFDNSCLLDSLKTVGPSQGRGVVVLDPEDIREGTLQQWHDLGVRGVRLNLMSGGEATPRGEKLRKIIRAHADAVRPMKTWVLQLLVHLPAMEDIEPLLPDLGVKLVFDHYGAPFPYLGQEFRAKGSSSMPAWDSLIRMLDTSLAYVKISAPYRLANELDYLRLYYLEAMTKILLSVNAGNAVVFASDWPHTRYERADVKPFLDKCLQWCDGEQSLADKLFRDNARRLWDVQSG